LEFNEDNNCEYILKNILNKISCHERVTLMVQ